jgi:hydroxypyruvate isomerase
MSERPRPVRTSRRKMLETTAGVAALGAAALRRAALADEPAARRGRIKQSIVHWCFEKYWSVEETAKVAKALGCQSVEIVPPRYFPVLKEHGLVCAIAPIDMGAGAPPFVRGFNNPKYHEQVIQATRSAIDACAEYGFRNVISFTGFRENIPDAVGAANCVEAYKRVVGYAEKRRVTICLEMLNTRAADHPMKGHPGYQGNHTDYCIDIIKRVGSPNLKLLFDVYHVQIMDGDVIRRLREHRDYIGHVHTAGNPGRGELDDKQEINYKPIMEALVEIGYQGYVGQEFIPTRDPLDGLREAVRLCDV